MAELEEIRSLIRLQSNTLQAQITALQAVLQATKGLIQTGRNGIGGETVSPIPRSTSLDLELLVSKPTSLGDTFALARVTKARLDDQQVSIVSQAITVASRGASQGTQSSRISTAVSEPAAWSPIASHSYISDIPWVCGHKCPSKFMTDEEEDTEPVTEENQEDALEGGDTLILNSLVGYGNLQQLHQVVINIQGLPMDVDLYVLPRKGPNIVLGIQWLQNLGKVTHDYSNKTMEFSWSGRDYALKGEEHVTNFPKDEHEGPPEEATWVWLLEFKIAYLSYHLEDKVISKVEKNVTPEVPRDGRTKRTKFKPE
nr:hypothetical protein [Tanacetum cinerariifolium]